MSGPIYWLITWTGVSTGYAMAHLSDGPGYFWMWLVSLALNVAAYLWHCLRENAA